jgi:predicted SprT family Zn-dependent metalloprotease
MALNQAKPTKLASKKNLTQGDTGAILSTDMKIQEAQHLAMELIEQFNITDYSFKFDNSLSRFGYCSYTQKNISLSTNLVLLNDEGAVRLTILHEIAHALTPQQHHNEVWQRVCKAIGGNGERCYDDKETETPLSKYTAHCPSCGKDSPRNRKKKNIFCGDCYKNNGNRLNKKFKLKYKLN